MKELADGWTRRRLIRSFGAIAGLGIMGSLLGCGSGPQQASGQQPESETETAIDATQQSPVVSLYRSPTCGCCKEYERYLAKNGFTVNSTVTEATEDVKRGLAIPQEMWSCHTTIMGKYFAEGHIPVEVIRRLLVNRPAIDGIALPGMPAGSTGMGGEKAQPLIIYAITEGEAEEFAKA